MGKMIKFLILSIYLLLFLFLKRLLPEEKKINFSILYNKWLIPPFIICIISHLYFWSLPIPTGEDFQVYCGIPAVFLYKISSCIPLWISVIFSIIALAISYIYIKGIGKKIWYIFFLLGLFIAIFLIFFIPESALGFFHRKEIVTMGIFRHPPIPKTIYLLGYIFFGINEYVGRVIQFLFLCFTGIYVGKIICLLISKKDNFAFICGYSITLLFPTFFHFTNFCSLITGEIFFLSASFYYFLSYIKEGEEDSLFYSLSILGIGLLYERKLLAFFIFMLFFLIKNRVFWKYGAIPLIMGLPFILTSYPYRNASLLFLWKSDPSLLFLGLKQIYLSLGPFLSILILISFFFSFKIKKSYIFSLFFLFFYLFITSTGAVGWIRHAQDYYFSLCILLSLFVAHTRSSLLIITLFVMLYQGIFSSSPLLFNLSNYKSKEWTAGFGIFPYRETIFYIKENLCNAKIYAPMGCCEPSRFYLAKFKLKRENWIREPTILKNIDMISLYKWCKENSIDYIVLPLTGDEKYLADILDLNLIREIYKPNIYFKVKKVFFFGENSLFLAKVK